MGRRRRHSPEQIIHKLREADRMMNDGASIGQVCQALEVSEATYHRWRHTFGGAKGEDMKQLKELEKENARLKRMVANLMLDKELLKELAKGNF